MKQTLIRIPLVILEVRVALGAIAGGIGLLTETIPVSLEGLQGSPFVDYTIPSLSLMVIVGGGMLFAAATILSGREIGVLAWALAGLIMMGFEIVEAAVIDRIGGNELLFAVSLQAFYFALGLAIFVLACSLWVTEYRSEHFPAPAMPVRSKGQWVGR
jgi:hypothetical protein